MSEQRHGAIIRVDFKLLLKMLDFEGGTIHRVYTDDDYLDPNYCNIILEHPDLPEVATGERLPEITPVYQLTFSEGAVVKVERVSPKNTKNLLTKDFYELFTSEMRGMYEKRPV